MNKKLLSKLIISSIMMLPFLNHNSSAQSLVDVTVSSNVFSPGTISINIGDTVRWTNIGGSHNVNGTVGAFPNNPESFGNAVGSGWVYTHVFTMAGNYEYRCDPHAIFGMVGSITVGTTTGIDDINAKDLIDIYPVPTSKEITINVGQELIKEKGAYSVEVYDILGNQVIYFEKVLNTKLEIDLSTLPKSVYFYKINSEGSLLKAGKLIKE